MARVAGLRQELLRANLQMEEDIRARQIAEAELSERCSELTELNQTLSKIQEQLIQSEKMASLGQLAAGVAHEINTPIGFVLSNLGTLKKYFNTTLKALDAYETAGTQTASQEHQEYQDIRQQFDLDFMCEDIPALIDESRDGIQRIGQIVRGLKDFSQIEADHDWQLADLHHELDAALNLVTAQFPGMAQILKEYGTLPKIRCMPAQVHQVFMNLLINAHQAINPPNGKITLRTGTSDDTLWFEFIDNGCGIPADIQNKIFDPFFTTRPVGKGAGLGLSLSYGIVKNHKGRIDVVSQPEQGTCFRVSLPLISAEH